MAVPRQTDKRVVMVGDPNVGKTLFISCYLDKPITGTSPTVARELHPVQVTVDAELVPISLWDTAGQERYMSLTPSYLRDADGVFCMFDVTEERTLINCEKWLSMVHEANCNVPVILLANKIDLITGDNLLREKYLAFAQKHSMECVETSAVTGVNVVAAMNMMGRLVKNRTSHVTTKLIEEKKDCC